MAYPRFKHRSHLLKPETLPKLKNNAFKYYGEIGYTGSIIRCPARRSRGIMQHLGIVWGFDIRHRDPKNWKNHFWIIENSYDGVRCVPLPTFLNGEEIYEIELMKNPDYIETIMIRAFRRSRLPYHSIANNCEHFVNYCVNGVYESYTVQAWELIADIFLFIFGIDKYLTGNKRLINEHKQFCQALKNNLLYPKLPIDFAPKEEGCKVINLSDYTKKQEALPPAKDASSSS